MSNRSDILRAAEIRREFLAQKGLDMSEAAHPEWTKKGPESESSGLKGLNAPEEINGATPIDKPEHTTILRHAGSRDYTVRPGASFGNQQYAGCGYTRRCGKCGKTASLTGPGWRRHPVMGMVGPCCHKKTTT